MRLRFKCFYLMYVFNYIVVESPVGLSASDLKFHSMALGHSGLLIYWDSTKVDERSKFNFTYKALTLKTVASHQATIEGEEYLNNAKGQHKLHSLNADTQYEITIRDTIYDKNYTVKCKTNLKNNSPPEKPYFTWEIYKPSNHGMNIKWVPCGKERNCHGNEAGTNFAVKYKILDSRETATVSEYFDDNQDIKCIYAGRIYEFTVISINGDSETISDPQEVFIQPCSSAVHSVKVRTWTNTSLYISWKEPKWLIRGIDLYWLIHTSKSGERIAKLNWDTGNETNHEDATSYNEIKLDHLEPNIVNTITIIPVCSEPGGIGFEYRFDHLIEAIQTNLPLAKPDFKFDIHKDTNGSCYLNIFWIPCPETSDCKTMNIGTDCEVKIQGIYGTETYSCFKKYSPWPEPITTRFGIDKNYIFIGKSVNEFNQTSDSVTKRISCKGIEDL